MKLSIWAVLGRPLGTPSEFLGWSLGVLGRPWGTLGRLLGYPWAVLGRSSPLDARLQRAAFGFAGRLVLLAQAHPRHTPKLSTSALARPYLPS